MIGRDVNFGLVLLLFLCFGIFLSLCYMFLSVFSVFFDFVVFSPYFAVFRVAASQISRFSLILPLVSLRFAIMFCNFDMLLSFPFNWLYVGLNALCFVQVSYSILVSLC